MGVVCVSESKYLNISIVDIKIYLVKLHDLRPHAFGVRCAPKRAHRKIVTESDINGHLFSAEIQAQNIK